MNGLRGVRTCLLVKMFTTAGRDLAAASANVEGAEGDTHRARHFPDGDGAAIVGQQTGNEPVQGEQRGGDHRQRRDALREYQPDLVHGFQGHRNLRILAQSSGIDPLLQIQALSSTTFVCKMPAFVKLA